MTITPNPERQDGSMPIEPRTATEFIRWTHQFPDDTLIGCDGHGGIVALDPQGGTATPRLLWISEDEIVRGTRVRKPYYSDTGTVVSLDVVPVLGIKFMHPSHVAVKWDTTGQSIERRADLGLAIERDGIL